MRPAHLFAAAILCLSACSDSDTAQDAGPDDAGASDAGPVDAGALDAGGMDAGLDAGDTWNNYAMGFFQSYCVSCHSPTGGDPGDKNFTQYASVVKYSALIRCGVSTSHQADWNCPSNVLARQFPIGHGAMPQDSERDRLVAWIDAGMPE